ncbi:MAG: glycosyltransferase family 2 protein [Gammaproteobacteria bacterium]|nr:glycosyltransferase family 2 protein [Gammaproteobacteria bacterium]MCP5137343.1 glycosyltransferase family 2 protein [Gammaproteobacteria bacterium]
MEESTISIVIPARNESGAIAQLLTDIRQHFPVAEIVVVNDGSDDDTGMISARLADRVVDHPYPMGNGAAIKSGARAARGEVLVFMDGDGQHRAADIQRLLDGIDAGMDMVVAARTKTGQASIGRAIANRLYNRFASWMVNHRIDDLTSGFRAVRAAKFREFLFLLPNGFSYPSTITMAFFRAGYAVHYEPIEVQPRVGTSHISPLRDATRFLLIIFKIGTLYSPLKLFFPASLAFFFTGIGYYIHTFLTMHRFTNMSALLFIVAIVVFLIGLVSEQIANLTYARKD